MEKLNKKQIEDFKICPFCDNELGARYEKYEFNKFCRECDNIFVEISGNKKHFRQYLRFNIDDLMITIAFGFYYNGIEILDCVTLKQLFEINYIIFPDSLNIDDLRKLKDRLLQLSIYS